MDFHDPRLSEHRIISIEVHDDHHATIGYLQFSTNHHMSVPITSEGEIYIEKRPASLRDVGVWYETAKDPYVYVLYDENRPGRIVQADFRDPIDDYR